MNKTFSETIALLREQLALFLEVEDISDKIILKEPEELPQLLELRGELIEKASTIKKKIDTLCEAEPLLLDVLRAVGDMSNLSDESSRVYEASMRVRAAVNRISKMDAEVYLKIEREKNAALEQLEALNSSMKSVAESYRRAAQTGVYRLDGDNDLIV